MTVLHCLPPFLSSYFNSHPHKEDDKNDTLGGDEDEYFNSHPHKEDDEAAQAKEEAAQAFQLTSSQGG